MIKRLENSNVNVATEMMKVFMDSYAIEAKLLNASDFPPLKRPLESYQTTVNDFFGYYHNDELAAVIEIAQKPEHTHIQSLVVSPKFFRRGIGSKLIQHVLDRYKTTVFMVETGAENGPATKLYLTFGFVEVLQYNTDFGIKKVRFERRS